MTHHVQTVLSLKADRGAQRDPSVLLKKRQLQSHPIGNESIRWRSLTNFSFCPYVLSSPDPGSRAAAGTFSRAGPVHGAGSEASLWAGLSRTPRHAYAVWLRGESHAGSEPTGGIWAHAVTDGPSRQLPWYGWNGGHGASSCQHDETKDDECQQAHEAPAATEVTRTTSKNTQGFLVHYFT